MDENDPRELLEAGKFEELAQDEHPLWRGLALLELKRFVEAAQVFEEAPDAKGSGTMLELAGAARWLSGDRDSAIARWVAALEGAYDTPGGPVKPPALLVYAGKRLGDERYVLRGTRLLGKLWKPKVARMWPGPVAGFLVGALEQDRFLDDGFESPQLEARRLCSAHFWAGVKAEHPEQAQLHFKAAVEQEGPSVLEVEHHLAHGELQPAAPAKKE